LYSFPNIIWAIKLWKTDRVKTMYGGKENYMQNFSQNLRGRHHLEDVGVDGRIT
jgi:hypothetical protein